MLHVERKQIDPWLASGPHEVDPFRVAQYAKAMGEGATFPPVRVVEAAGRFTIIDGHHRVRAARRACCQMDALVVDEEEFEDLDAEIRHTGQRADDEQFWVAPDPDPDPWPGGDVLGHPGFKHEEKVDG